MPTLKWIGKEAVENHHLEIPYKMLKCVSSLSAGDKDTGNLIVQGDNLEALKALLPYYAGQIKCIYIDPPYNTGNEEWVFNDNVNDPQIQEWFKKWVKGEEEDLTRHDKWLCMMYPRLQLLRKLLDLDGVIFISIDDTELNRLKLLCDEIFGPKSFISCLVWEKKKKGTHLDKTRISVKEYILVYCKDRFNFNGLIGEIMKDKETYPCVNPGNKRDIRIIPKNTNSNFKEKNYFLAKGSRISEGNMYLDLKSDLIIENGKLKENVEIDGEWRYSQISINEFSKNNELYLTRDLYIRRIVTEPRYKKLKDLLFRLEYETINESKDHLISELLKKNRDEIKISTLLKELSSMEDLHHMDINEIDNLNNSGWGSNEDGDEEIRQIFGKKVFDFPKPTKLILKLIASTRFENGIFLDSFAGTGTFGHAILRLNKLFEGNRQFILVELVENICKDITRERIVKAINGYSYSKTKEENEKVEGLGGGFKYCILDEPLFDEYGNIKENVSFNDLAHHIFFTETGVPLDAKFKNKEKSAKIGIYKETAYYLLFNGIMGDNSVSGGNVLTTKILEKLPVYKGKKIIYGEGCRLSPTRLKRENIIFKQLPYEVKVS